MWEALLFASNHTPGTMGAKDLIVTCRQLATIGVIAIQFLIISHISYADDPLPSRVYNATYDQVYKATKLAFSNSGMSMVKEEKGYLEAFGPDVGATSPANVGVFITTQGPNETEVRFNEHLNRWKNVFPNRRLVYIAGRYKHPLSSL